MFVIMIYINKSCLSSQYIEAADLEDDMLKENPSKYHEAWHQLVGAE